MITQECSRIILGLRTAGWDEKAIANFILWTATGEEQYKPNKEEVFACKLSFPHGETARESVFPRAFCRMLGFR